MNDFCDGYSIDEIGSVPVYTVTAEGQLVPSDQIVMAYLVVEVEQKPIFLTQLGPKKIGPITTRVPENVRVGNVFAYHPKALIFDTSNLELKNKSWAVAVDIQKIVQLNNVNIQKALDNYSSRAVSIRANSQIQNLNIPQTWDIQDIIEFSDINQRFYKEVAQQLYLKAKVSIGFNQFTLEAISDPQPDYDADFVTVSLEGNHLVPAHGPTADDQSVWLSFSAKNQSVFTWDVKLQTLDIITIPQFNQTLERINSVTQTPMRVIDFHKFNQTLENIGQDNLMITLKSKSNPSLPSYKIPVLMTK